MGRRGCWSVAGATFTYRTPFLQDGSWRVRRRSIITGGVSTFVLKDPDGMPPRSLKQARDLVADLAMQERLDAEEIARQPEDRTVKPESIAAAFDEWLTNIEHEVRAPTHLDYKTQLGVVRAHFIAKGLHTVAEIQLAHVEELFRTLGQEWRGRTKIKYLALLKRVFNWCVQHRYTRANPAAGMTPHKSLSKAVAQSRFRGLALTEDQARALLAACREPFKTERKPSQDGGRAGQAPWSQGAKPPDYLFPAVLLSVFALRTGYRLRNVSGLRWRHLPNKMTELKILGQEMKSGEPLHVPLHPEATAMLENRLNACTAALHRAPNGDRLVFGPEAASIAQPFTRALKRAGLTDIDGRRVRFHDLRHTWASWCERYCTFAAVQRLLGHAPQSMTHRYVHLNMEQLRKEVERIPWLEPKAAAGQQSVAARV